MPARDALGPFPPELTVEIKALACELPTTLGLPLSRLSAADVARHAERSGLVARISDSTVWRWLHEDAIRPWQHRCWIFPRDPHFQLKASRILDLYERCWQGKPLRDDEFVISTDEKTSIQARLRIHPSLATEPAKSMRVEHEYTRGGAWAYLAALDVHRAKVFGRCESTTGIAPFQRLVDQVMSQPPYETARRVFWIMDNGSHGYLVQRLNPEAVEGRKSFQPSDDIHVEIEFHVVCAPKLSNGSRVFVSALEDRYIVSRTSGSASLGVGPLGSLSLPIRSTTGSLVKTSSETIRVVDLYHRFFALIEHELAQLETDPTQDPAHAILPPPVTAPSPAEPISAPPCEYSPQLEKNEPGAGAVSCPVK